MYIFSKRVLVRLQLEKALFNFCRFGLQIFKGAIFNPLRSFQSTLVCGLFYYTHTHTPATSCYVSDGLALNRMLSLFIFERTNTECLCGLCAPHLGALGVCVCMCK